MSDTFTWWSDWSPEGPWSDRRVLDSWNGRPTLAVDAYGDDNVVLRWMLMGHVEPIDIWLMFPLEQREAEEIIRSPESLFKDWVTRFFGRPAQLQLIWTDDYGKKRVISEPWVIPAAYELDDLCDEAFRTFMRAIKDGRYLQSVKPRQLDAVLRYLSRSLAA